MTGRATFGELLDAARWHLDRAGKGPRLRAGRDGVGPDPGARVSGIHLSADGMLPASTTGRFVRRHRGRGWLASRPYRTMGGGRACAAARARASPGSAGPDDGGL
jgi:hypothetical protein